MTVLSSLSWKKLGIIAIGNIAIIGSVIYKLKQLNPTSSNDKLITRKNVLFGYIAMSSSLVNQILGYGQLSFFSNIPQFFPGNVLNKYFPHSLDQNDSRTNSKLLFKRIFLCSLFCLHHSVFARHSVKEWLSNNNIVSLRIERSMYMLLSQVLTVNLINNWNDKQNNSNGTDVDEDDSVLWKFKRWCNQPWYIQYGPFVITVLIGNVVCMSVVPSDEFVGISDAFNVNFWTDRATKYNNPSTQELSVSGFYSMVRHPQMFFNIVAFLIVPKMTVSRFTLTALFFIYVMFGIQLEEKDLIKVFGEQYIEYQKQVPQIIPTWPIFKTIKLE